MSEEQSLYERGLQIRTEVVGEAYVKRSLADAEANPFTLPMQELVTKYCWGDIWARPGLSRRDRSLLNLGMIAALNRPDELTAHVRGAVQNGVTKEEITEIFLQVAIYCGMPAGLGSFKVAKQVFSELEKSDAAEKPRT